MSILESIGVVAAIGFGAAGLYFGWRADQRAKTAEQIAKDSNRIAEESKAVATDANALATNSNEIANDSNRIATEANEIARSSDSFQRELALDQRAARLWIGEPWVYQYAQDFAIVAVRYRNEGKALARDLKISLFRNGEPHGQPETPSIPIGDKELTTQFRILYLRDKSANPDDVYLLRFEYRDELPERHSIERCFRVWGIRNDERSEEWQFVDSADRAFDGQGSQK